jgi:hypothetical protein
LPKAPKNTPLGRCAFPYERPRITLLPYADRVSAPSPFRQPPGPSLFAPLQHLCAYPRLREPAAFRVLADMRRGYLAPLFSKEAIIVWWAQTYSLGISEWSYGPDRPYSPRVGRLGAVPLLVPLLRCEARSAKTGMTWGLCSGLVLLFWGLCAGGGREGAEGATNPRARQTIELRNLWRTSFP